MRVAEPRSARKHRIVVGRHGYVAPETRINSTQECELASARCREIARARHDTHTAFVELLQEHCCLLTLFVTTLPRTSDNEYNTCDLN
jgi:hypothetical protein